MEGGVVVFKKSCSLKEASEPPCTAHQVVKSLLRFWPRVHSPKEVCGVVVILNISVNTTFATIINTAFVIATPPLNHTILPSFHHTTTPSRPHHTITATSHHHSHITPSQPHHTITATSHHHSHTTPSQSTPHHCAGDVPERDGGDHRRVGDERVPEGDGGALPKDRSLHRLSSLPSGWWEDGGGMGGGGGEWSVVGRW